MKYIDAEKLIEGIKHIQSKFPAITYEALFHLITSLQQELPEIPSNLDEAAEKIAWDIAPNHPDISWDNCFEKIKKGIKAGAEWMAGQGATMEITDDTEWADLDSFVHKNVTGGSIIQIRKK